VGEEKVRTQREVSTATESQSGLIARDVMERLRSGALPGQATGSANERTVSAVNAIAKGVVTSLKAGGLLSGTVRAQTKLGDVDAVWVVVQLPLLGERKILIKNQEHLRVGQDVAIECVPTLSDSKRYVFRVANGTPAPSAGHNAGGAPRYQ
jgi:hypothetical protein